MQYLSLVVFTTEMVTKIIACGEQPLTYGQHSLLLANTLPVFPMFGTQ